MGFLNSSSTFASAVQSLIGIINLLVSVLSALALVVFFIGLVRYVKDSGDAHGHAEGRERITWSLIALFVLFSIWGILNLLSISFFGTSNVNPGDTGPLNIAPQYNGSSGGTSQGNPGGTGGNLGGFY